MQEWQLHRAEIDRRIGWLYSQRLRRDVGAQLHQLQKQLDRIDAKISGLSPRAREEPVDQLVAAQLTPAQARELTDEAKQDVAMLWAKLYALHEGGAPQALGYFDSRPGFEGRGDWRAYCAAEFGLATQHEPRVASGRCGPSGPRAQFWSFRIASIGASGN